MGSRELVMQQRRPAGYSGRPPQPYYQASECQERGHLLAKHIVSRTERQDPM